MLIKCIVVQDITHKLRNCRIYHGSESTHIRKEEGPFGPFVEGLLVDRHVWARVRPVCGPKFTKFYQFAFFDKSKFFGDFFFAMLEIFIFIFTWFKLNKNTWYPPNVELEILGDAYYIPGHIIFCLLSDLIYFEYLNNF